MTWGGRASSTISNTTLARCSPAPTVGQQLGHHFVAGPPVFDHGSRRANLALGSAQPVTYAPLGLGAMAAQLASDIATPPFIGVAVEHKGASAGGQTEGTPLGFG